MTEGRIGTTKTITPAERGIIQFEYTDRWSAFDRGASEQEIPGIGAARCACVVRSFELANQAGLLTSTYTIAEVAADGYTTTYDNCSDVAVAAGGTATCTVTNDDVAPPAPPQTPPTDNSGGGGGGTVLSGPLSVGFQNGGQVLGTSTEAGNGQVLGASTQCTPYLTTYLRIGLHNDPAQVKKLQIFLNSNLGINLPTTGFFGPLTLAAVKQFQLKYAAQILSPWGIESPTGYVYKTTVAEINALACQQ